MGAEALIREQHVEALAWWRVGLPDGQRALADAATDALVHGTDGIALAELAGLPSDENPFAVDALAGRVAEELNLQPDLAGDLEALVARRMCRSFLAGGMTERELSRWVHQRFHHESDSELLNVLAELDDEYDQYVGYARAEQDAIPTRQRIRRVAEEIVAN
ncbi:hypothetical protein [Microterricola viridarii]|uniref:Uncharacterized protein n=1 Tax=Microterricola viridarii TaxID=412690 RepID=A0A0X8E220_9MICO|nr:hypothetical protein [Microterricola viridarii]AMB58966.1 hypothetical protein AWU67_08945 [Microterricola viridarii]